MRSTSVTPFRSSALLVLLLAAVPALAHDFWIEPSSYSPQPGELVSLRLRVGNAFIGDPVPRDPVLIERFISRNGKREDPVVGMSGRDPAGMLRTGAAGCSVVFYESRPSPATLPPERFAQYIREEGLETQIASAPTVPVIDRFSRSAVTVLRQPGQPCADITKSSTLTLQIVPSIDPATSATVPVRLLYHSKPLAKTTIIAIDRRNPRAEQRVVTDAKGGATLHLDSPGPWLIKAVRLEKQPDASYRSFWASLTFTR